MVNSVVATGAATMRPRAESAMRYRVAADARRVIHSARAATMAITPPSHAACTSVKPMTSIIALLLFLAALHRVEQSADFLDLFRRCTPRGQGLHHETGGGAVRS